MIETRTFQDIWNSWGQQEKDRFYEKLAPEGVKQSTVRSYGTGRRVARGPYRKALVRVFKKMGINVDEGQYLFADNYETATQN